jgi:hypothetical protein
LAPFLGGFVAEKLPSDDFSHKQRDWHLARAPLWLARGFIRSDAGLSSCRGLTPFGLSSQTNIKIYVALQKLLWNVSAVEKHFSQNGMLPQRLRCA